MRARRIIISIVVIVVVLTTSTLGFRAMRDSRPAAERSDTDRSRIVVRVLSVERRGFREPLTGYGEARALAAADVVAEVSGRVVRVARGLESGLRVEAPVPDAPPTEALVTIDSADYDRALADARARHAQETAAETRHATELASLESRVEAAERQYAAAVEEERRVSEMVRDKSQHKSALDRQRIETLAHENALLNVKGLRDAAKAEGPRLVARTQAVAVAVMRAETDVARSRIVSPIAGRVESRFVEEGSWVARGTKLFRVVDASRVEVAIALPASRFGEVGVGAPVSLRLSDDGEPVWSGKVLRVAPSVDRANRTYYVYVEVSGAANADAPVPPGAFVVGTVEGRTHADTFVLPRTAFLGKSVYVAEPIEGEPDFMVARERVVVVSRWMPDVALVASGLKPGERVILTSLEQIADGSKIRVAPAPDERSSGAGAERAADRGTGDE